MFLSLHKKFLRNQPLINKMMLLNTVGIASAMVIVFIIFSILYSFMARRTMSENLLAEAQLLAINSAPMLAFHDKIEAEKLAGSFKQVSNLLRVTIFDKKNDIFVDLPTAGEQYPAHYIQDLILNIQLDQARFETDRLFVFVPVTIEEERMGTIVMASGFDSIKTNLLMFVSIGTTATFFGILFSLLVLRKMQLWALAPIINMSNLVEKVSAYGAYHLRVETDGKDEVARLGGRLNQMLNRIEIWEKDLNEELDQSRESERQLDTLAKTDELTQLPNRLSFTQDLEKAVTGSLTGNKTIALLFVDLDDFKQVNDVYGHHAGDEVLRVTAERLSHILRKRQETDMLYRIGGDEFAALLGGVTEDEQTFAVCERLIASAGEKIMLEDGVAVQVGASVGLAFCPTHADSTAELLNRADLAMYEAKRNGKNHYRVFEEWMEESDSPATE